MPLVVGVSFKKAGKVYYFDPIGLELREGDHIIAETARGIEFGEVLIEPKNVPDEDIVPPLKKIVRKANQADLEREEHNRQREKHAYFTCQQRIHVHNLPMKLIDAEYCFDGSQVTFFFSSESRVDFRELVKDLASSLRTKVQLHQVGVRDEAKLFGGLGPCGRSLCCTSFLNGFEPVSMKMAKEQSLFLNPLKFSGICGKLMCCLKYEYPTYREARQRLPSVGTSVTTPQGTGRIVDVNLFKESLCVELPDGMLVHCLVTELVVGDGKCGCPNSQEGCNGCSVENTGETAAIKPVLPPTPQQAQPQRPKPEERPDRDRPQSGNNKNGNRDPRSRPRNPQKKRPRIDPDPDQE